MPLTLTRAVIAGLDEKDLREHVLVPLFRAMKFQDVVEWHGGTLEQGKDIVMWKANDAGIREDYGVVVKAGRISGQARGKGSAAEVTFQVQQALGSTYLDPLTAAERRLTFVYVVTNGQISKEAIHSINNALPESMRCQVKRYVGIDGLWDLLREFNPRRLVVDQLRQVGQVLDGAAAGYEIRATTGGGVTTYDVRARSGTETPPEPIGAELRFDLDSPVGQANRVALERHRATGKSALLRDVQVSLDLPVGLRELIGDLPTTATVEFGPRRSPHSIVCRPVFNTRDGEEVAFDTVRLGMVRGGDQELLLEGSDLVGWTWRLTVRLDRPACSIQVDCSLAGPIKQVVELARMVRRCARGGRVRLIDIGTGRVVVAGEVPAGAIPDIPGWLDQALRWAGAVEELAGMPLRLPSRPVTADDLLVLERLWRIVTVGVETGTVGRCWFMIARDQFETLEASLSRGDPVVFRQESRPMFELWGESFSPGPVVITLQAMSLLTANEGSGAVVDEEGLDGESVKVTLVHVGADDNASFRYLHWPRPVAPSQTVAETSPGADA